MGRRKYGTGTVRKRTDGRWEARVVVGYDDKGNPKTKNVLAKTKAECLEKLKKLREQYAPPVTKYKSDMLFGDWIDFWYQTYCKPQLRLNTQLGYEDSLPGYIEKEYIERSIQWWKEHYLPSIEKRQLMYISESDIDEFINLAVHGIYSELIQLIDDL